MVVNVIKPVGLLSLNYETQINLEGLGVLTNINYAATSVHGIVPVKLAVESSRLGQINLNIFAQHTPSST